jgi:ABC-type lipoprotein release transport system permease subunit
VDVLQKYVSRDVQVVLQIDNFQKNQSIEEEIREGRQYYINDWKQRAAIIYTSCKSVKRG